MKVLVTGSDGFIAKNLLVHLAERADVEVLPFTRRDGLATLAAHVRAAEFVFHLAGVNRPSNEGEFETGNYDLTRTLCDLIAETGHLTPVVFSSSTQAALDNPYGQSKRRAEALLTDAGSEAGFPVYVFRLPNVFGKWARPDYNSAIATFCHNIARGLPIRIDDPAASFTAVYVDDVVSKFLEILDGRLTTGAGTVDVEPQYTVRIGDLAAQLRAFAESRASLVSERVGTGLVRALYATYVSYLPPAEFSYAVPRHADSRGVFVEMLKTKDSGQFSFFTAGPGITRGGHYHHTKTEKFLILRGEGLFRFRHLITGELIELKTSDVESRIVETIPGWTHDITNTGEADLVVMLWANEIFDRSAPDTYAQTV
ncbi:NAD-dependent epimerase/dehydratase family protein [Brevundimonas sp. Root1423]|uniref:UDP-2-acetamido-2,6-beta-L-arabino-hexul-4-ose reductase n=1 Tax=Brevundimonas sp. Root1423 TaxID=1736462 RepID=UPI0006FCE29F|nr:NAD-dependent epimerase/dehydratase family protein [Brevundimonas sp. Root1423]KQY84845.1 capsular biosynthesis protein [Brevundimonas sp. Root1423]